MHESCGILCAANLVLTLDSEVGHTADVGHLGVHHLLVNFLTSFVTLQPFPHHGFFQPSLDAGLAEHIMARDVLFVFEIRLEQFLDQPRLDLRAFGLRQLDQTMAVPRITRLATELEVDPDVLARGVQTLEDHLRTLLAEFALVVLTFIDALFWRGRVEVKWKPGGGEGVLRVWMTSLVQRDSSLEFVLADIALRR